MSEKLLTIDSWLQLKIGTVVAPIGAPNDRYVVMDRRPDGAIVVKSNIIKSLEHWRIVTPIYQGDADAIDSQ